MAEKVKPATSGPKYAPYAMTKDIVKDMFPVEETLDIPWLKSEDRSLHVQFAKSRVSS